MRTVTVSNLDEIIRTQLNPQGVIETDPTIPQIISNLNTMAFHTAADLTAYDVTNQWIAKASVHIVKMCVNICIASEMPTHTDDDVRFHSVTISVTEAPNGDVIWTRKYTTGLGLFDAALEERLFIVADTTDQQNFRVNQGQAYDIRILCEVEEIGSGTNPTFFQGLAPFFPTTVDTNSKFFSQSGVVMYLYRERHHPQDPRDIK